MSAKNEPGRFPGARLVHSRTMVLAAPPERVFPLLCPVLEYDWIEHWRCIVAYSESGVAELGCTFVTEFPDHGREVWTCTEYRPDNAITWLRVHPDRTVCLDLKLEPAEDGAEDDATRLFWTATATGVSKAGNSFVEKVFGPGYEQDMELIQRMLEHYLAHGRAMPTAKILAEQRG